MPSASNTAITRWPLTRAFLFKICELTKCITHRAAYLLGGMAQITRLADARRPAKRAGAVWCPDIELQIEVIIHAIVDIGDIETADVYILIAVERFFVRLAEKVMVLELMVVLVSIAVMANGTEAELLSGGRDGRGEVIVVGVVDVHHLRVGGKRQTRCGDCGGERRDYGEGEGRGREGCHLDGV